MRVERNCLPRVKRVLLDGEPVKDAIWADDETGEIERAVRDQNGRLVAKDDHIVTEIVRGVVTIELA